MLGVSRNLGLDRILHRESSRAHSCLGGAETQFKAGDFPGLVPREREHESGGRHGSSVTGNEMLSMLDWLLERQRWIERTLASRHLKGGTLVLYDVTSSYFEGRSCPLAFSVTTSRVWTL